MVAKSIYLVVLLACLLHRASGFQWKKCGDGRFTVKDVTLTPAMPQPGGTAQFSIDADAEAEVEQGTVNMVVTYAGLPIWTQNDDLCSKTSCPVNKGPAVVVYQQAFPIFTPPGHYTVTLRGISKSDLLFCVAVDFEVVPPSLASSAATGVTRLQRAAGALLKTHRKEMV